MLKFAGSALLFFGFIHSTLIPSAFGGFTFAPVIAELAPSGPKSSGAFTLRNQTEERTPVMISIVHRDPASDGKEEYKETPDIDDMFQIYPSQLILGPNDLRTVRISWIGNPNLKSELAFRMIAEELPFSMESEAKSNKKVQAEIKIATRYIGSLYVTPPDAAPALEMIAKPIDPALKIENAKLQLEITNTGTRHIMLNGIKIKVSAASGAAIEISEEDHKPIRGENLLAGKMRRFYIKGPSQLPAGPYKVTFELPQKK